MADRCSGRPWTGHPLAPARSPAPAFPGTTANPRQTAARAAPSKSPRLTPRPKPRQPPLPPLPLATSGMDRKLPARSARKPCQDSSHRKPRRWPCACPAARRSKDAIAPPLRCAQNGHHTRRGGQRNKRKLLLHQVAQRRSWLSRRRPTSSIVSVPAANSPATTTQTAASPASVWPSAPTRKTTAPDRRKR